MNPEDKYKKLFNGYKYDYDYKYDFDNIYHDKKDGPYKKIAEDYIRTVTARDAVLAEKTKQQEPEVISESDDVGSSLAEMLNGL